MVDYLIQLFNYKNNLIYINYLEDCLIQLFYYNNNVILINYLEDYLF